jgi:RNA polymerase sigma-70 factor (ECF subfamily)
MQETLPGILAGQAGLLEAMLGDETHLSRSQKEQILLAVSAANQSSYGVALHEQMLKLLGTSEREIAAIVEGRMPESHESALVTFARKLVLESAAVQQADIDQLKSSGFTRPQIVELVILVGFGNLLDTVQAGFGAAPDFAARPIPAPAVGDKVHRQEPQLRPIVEDVQSDPDLADVVRAQGGDLTAFETLVERHSQRVYRTLAGLLGNADEAKDAVQDTFLKVYQNLGRFERRSRFSTWLVSIASNVGLQRLRDRKQVVSLDDGGSDQEEFRPRQVRAWDDDPEERYSKEERRQLVERAISHLPAKYRVVVVLRDVQQVSTEEAAASLGLSVPALKARLLRARLMLRESLAPHFMEGAQGA